MANFNGGIRYNQLAPGVTAVTGASGSTIAGPTLPMNDVAPGTGSARVYAQATTNTLTLTPKWQVSADGSTWLDVKLANNAANVTLVTGTGSAVAATIALAMPDACYGWLYSRVSLLTGGTTASTGDEYNIGYNYLARGWAR